MQFRCFCLLHTSKTNLFVCLFAVAICGPATCTAKMPPFNTDPCLYDPARPKLQLNYCDPIATCTTDYSYENNYYCTCPIGFAKVGDFSCIDNDECLSGTVCGSNAECTNTAGSYTCACSTGFIIIGGSGSCVADLCLNSPCQHNGSCTPKTTKFVCTCTLGYTGLLCESKIDLCTPDPCSSSGVCTDLGDSFSCTCAPSFSGALCDTFTSPCINLPCGANGICSVDSANASMFVCSCTAPFSGVTCTHDTNCDDVGTFACYNSTRRAYCGISLEACGAFYANFNFNKFQNIPVSPNPCGLTPPTTSFTQFTRCNAVTTKANILNNSNPVIVPFPLTRLVVGG